MPAAAGTEELREALAPSKLQPIYRWWHFLSPAGEGEQLEEGQAEPASHCLVLQWVLWAEIRLLQSQDPL